MVGVWIKLWHKWARKGIAHIVVFFEDRHLIEELLC